MSLSNNQYGALRDLWFAGSNGTYVHDKRTLNSLLALGFVEAKPDGMRSLFVLTTAGKAAYATDSRTDPAYTWILAVQNINALEELLKLRRKWHGNIRFALDSRKPWQSYAAMKSWQQNMASEGDYAHSVLMGNIADGLDSALAYGTTARLEWSLAEIQKEKEKK